MDDSVINPEDYKTIKLKTSIAPIDRLISLEKIYLIKEKKNNKKNNTFLLFQN